MFSATKHICNPNFSLFLSVCITMPESQKKLHKYFKIFSKCKDRYDGRWMDGWN